MHYVFGMSVRLSVRSPKYNLSTCTWVRWWVRWSIQPTMTVLRPVHLSNRPPVRQERFPGFSREINVRNGLEFGMLMYPDNLQTVVRLTPHFQEAHQCAKDTVQGGSQPHPSGCSFEVGRRQTHFLCCTGPLFAPSWTMVALCKAQRRTSIYDN